MNRASPFSFRTQAAALAVTLCAVLLTTACRREDPDLVHGYVEAEYVRVGAPVAGTLLKCAVERGTNVRAGDLLFVLESAAEQAASQEADRRAAQAAARLENLRKGRRPSEIAALEARIEQAQANLALADSELARREKLIRDQVIAPAELDRVRNQRDAGRAALEAAQAELATARLGAREDEISAAEAELAAAQAARERARWSMDQKTQAAPVDGFVHDTFYRPGEFVALGQPVVSLLPAANLKVRFFIPGDRLPELPTGTAVEVSVDGIRDRLTAKVAYRSTQPEFTPPVIYSRENRTRLVYMIEATPPAEAASQLHPGQPVDIHLPGRQ